MKIRSDSRSELAARAHSQAKQAGGGNLPAEDPGGCSDGIRDGVKYWEIIADNLKLGLCLSD